MNPVRAYGIYLTALVVAFTATVMFVLIVNPGG